jgi:hypothetical protein
MRRQVLGCEGGASSSRTHAVFKLHWYAPGPQDSSGGPSAPGASRRDARPASAPPRLRRPAASAAALVLMQLTLVDTAACSPLLPPKEAVAVKKGLLAVGRVLTAVAKGESMLPLRESKLTRLLDGSLDRAMLVACLAGSGDDSALTLLKMVVAQQGAARRAAPAGRRRGVGRQRRDARACDGNAMRCGAQPVCW